MSHEPSYAVPVAPEGSGEPDLPPLPLPDRASEAGVQAVTLLEVSDFIAQYLDSLFQRLEEFDRSAESAPMDADMMFLAMSLRIANSVIQIASDRVALERTIRWVSEWWEGSHPDPGSILAVLTLVYISDRIWERHREDPEKREMARRIRQRMHRLRGAQEEPGSQG